MAQKNIRQIPEWKKAHPHCQDSDSRNNDLYLKIVSNSMSGISDDQWLSQGFREAEKNYNKIKRNIVKEVIIDK